MTISKPETPGAGALVHMFFSEKRLDREIYWSGFGFQVWLQILTHLLRGNSQSIVIIDEPDIYLHPDLQRKLLRLLKGRFSQYFLATHSTEIINEAHVGSIVSITPGAVSPKRIYKDEEYQAVFKYLGSADNVEISKLARARRVIFVEGKDKKLLRKLAEKAGRGSAILDSDTLVLAAGGFSQWRRVAETAWTFENVLGVKAKIFAIFDRDFRCDAEIEEHELALDSVGIKCCVWRRKEIENYCLYPALITRAITRRIAAAGRTADPKRIDADIYSLTDEFRTHTLTQMLFAHQEYARSKKTTLHRTDLDKVVMEAFDQKWPLIDYRLSVIAGKDFIGRLCRYAQDEHEVTLSTNMLFDEIRSSDLDLDVRHVLGSLDEIYKD